MVIAATRKIECKFLFWLEKGKIKRAIIDYETNTVRFYNKDGSLIMIRRGLSNAKICEIENTIKKYKFAKKKISYFFGGI